MSELTQLTSQAERVLGLVDFGKIFSALNSRFQVKPGTSCGREDDCSLASPVDGTNEAAATPRENGQVGLDLRNDLPRGQRIGSVVPIQQIESVSPQAYLIRPKILHCSRMNKPVKDAPLPFLENGVHKVLRAKNFAVANTFAAEFDIRLSLQLLDDRSCRRQGGPFLHDIGRNWFEYGWHGAQTANHQTKEKCGQCAE